MPSIRPRFLLLSAACLATLGAATLTQRAAAQTAGTPLVQAFPRQVYGGGVGQVFDGAQDDRGLLYFVTADSGLLRFDGERWRSTEIEGFPRAIAIDDENRIWLAGANRIGYFAASNTGQLEFSDMTTLLPPDQRLFSETWPILVTNSGHYFASREYLFRYRDDPEPHFNAWPGSADEFFYRLYALDGRLLVAQFGVGLLELTPEDELVELGDGELGGTAEVNALFNLGGGSLLALTRLRGAFVVEGRRIERLDGPAAAWLEQQQVQHGCALPDGRFAVATRRGGIAIIDGQLNLHLVLDQQSGLTNRTVSVVFLDQRQDLWAATQDGVNRIVLETAAAGYGVSSGLPEAAVTKVLPFEEEFWAGTVYGLFRGDRIETVSGPALRFDPNPLLETQTWDLLPVGDGMLAATTDGLFELRSRQRQGIAMQATSQLSAIAAFDLQPLPAAPGDSGPTRIAIGMAGGLGLAVKEQDAWRFAGRLPAFQQDVWELERGQSGEVLAYMPDLSRVAIAELPEEPGGETRVHSFDTEGAGSFVRIGGEIHVTGSGEFWRYLGLGAARRGRAFERSDELAKLAELRVETVLLEDGQERLWVSTERGLRLATRLDSGGFELRFVSQNLDATPFLAVEDPIWPETFWVGTIDGLLRVAPRAKPEQVPAPTALVRRVVALGSGRELDGGAAGEVEEQVLTFEENALRFEYASPTYEQGFEVLYRVRLDGFDDSWTHWSEESSKEYTSLFEGPYTFRVQAQDVRGTFGPVASWSFRILPPWYRTSWALTGYFLGAVGLVLLLVRARTSRLDRRRQTLELLVESRTEELAAEKSQVESQARDLERVNRLLAEENEHRRHLEEERVKLQERAEQSQKLESLGLMAGGIAHDFNNILMAILGNADLCLEEGDLRPSLERRLRAISDAGRRAAELCQQMLAYAGKGSFEEREFDLSALAGETLEILRVSISGEIEVETHLRRGLPAVLGDSSKISQLVMNLLSNASEAIGRRHGRILIETGVRHLDTETQQELVLAEPIPEGPYVFVRVEDDGEGMDEETRRRIFDPFFTTKFAGRGLGMAAALGILRSHGGAISVESALGQGTTVAAYFPALEHAAGESAPQTPEGGMRHWQPTGTILVVDDEAVVRDVVELILRNTGFEVLTASSGQQALEIYGAEKRQIRAVILDLTMPGMDGLATFERLQLLDPDVVALLSSGYSGDTLIERYLEKGFAGFIAKPYRPASLRTALREILT